MCSSTRLLISRITLNIFILVIAHLYIVYDSNVLVWSVLLQELYLNYSNQILQLSYICCGHVYTYNTEYCHYSEMRKSIKTIIAKYNEAPIPPCAFISLYKIKEMVSCLILWNKANTVRHNIHVLYTNLKYKEYYLYLIFIIEVTIDYCNASAMLWYQCKGNFCVTVDKTT